MSHSPIVELTGGGDGGFILKILSQGGQLYNYVLYHYDITVLKLAHVHTVSACACVFACVSPKCFVVKFLQFETIHPRWGCGDDIRDLKEI